jgi:hypothetical protein
MWVDVAPDYLLVAHSHDADCLYYVLTGEIRAGARSFGPGSGFYVPTDVRYA